MASIDSITGITEVSDNLYEVTEVITLGSGIDDTNDATFIMKDGGLLKWGSGCSTTFTNCVFHETDTSLALGADNFRSYNAGYPPRFYDATTPIFKGCQWICNTATRSDFDLTPDAAPYFGKDEREQKTRIIIRNDNYVFAQYNHLASSQMIIDGLIVDQSGTGAAAEFAKLPDDDKQWKDLLIVDYEPSNTARHVTFLLADSNPVSTIRQLDSRNVALWMDNKLVKCIDPIGRILKSSEPQAHYGRWEVYRTYAGNFADASTGLTTQGRAMYHVNSEIFDQNFGDSYNVELLQLFQDYDTDVVTTLPDYTEVLQSYGFRPQQRVFTLTDETDPLANTKPLTLMFSDLSISELDEDIVKAYTAISDAGQLYDKSTLFSMYSSDLDITGFTLIEASGDTLDCGDSTIVVDPALSVPFAYTSSNNQALPETPANYMYVSSVKWYDAEQTTEAHFTEAAFQTVFSAGVPYQLNNFQFSDDGLKVFAFGTSSSSDSANVVVEYTLSIAYDLDTITQNNTFATGFINGQQGYGRIVDGGTKLIWSKRWGKWYRWDLSTPWDISTAGAKQEIPMTSRRTSVDFNADGTKLFTTRDGGDVNQCIVYEYTLSTPWDISSRGSESSLTLPVTSSYAELGSNFAEQRSFKWFDGGQYAIYNDGSEGIVYLLKATTAYSIVGLSIIQTRDYEVSEFAGIEICGDDNKLYVSKCKPVGGAYTIHNYPLFETYDYNGQPNTIYINSASLSATDKFKTLKTTSTISLNNGAVSDLKLVDANGVQTNVTIKGINPNTEVRMYRVSDGVMVDGVENSVGTQASINYTYLDPEDMIIVIHSEQYTTSPSRIEFTTQEASATLTVFQQLDRAYRNP
jgi:hypothetical protein